MAATTISEISRLSIADRIQLVEDVWDTIAASPEQLPLSDAQRVELDARLIALQEQPGAESSWDEVKRRQTIQK